MSQKWMTVLKVSGIIIGGFLILILAGSTWDYSGRPDFCISCHTMESVTRSHQTSAHAEVRCTDCHLGVGFAPTMLLKKATDASQIVKNLTGTYERPIRIRHNVPVKQSCESCHYTKAFRREMVKVTDWFEDDRNNTRKTTAILLKVGDGSQVEGIHWHVENSIVYGKDAEGQIVSIEVEKTDGTTGTYRKEGAGDPVTYKKMDCVDCHNRVAHQIDTPSSIADKYLLEGKLDASLPYVKREVVRLLEQTKDTDPARWPELFAGIVKFYQDKYPHVYEAEQEKIEELPAVVAEMAGQINFPNMNVTWETYEDNLGHDGCFQCHNPNFKLETASEGSELPQTVSMNCEICHDMPVTVEGGNKQVVIDLM